MILSRGAALLSDYTLRSGTMITTIHYARKYFYSNLNEVIIYNGLYNFKNMLYYVIKHRNTLMVYKYSIGNK